MPDHLGGMEKTMDKIRLNDDERKQWVMNDEGLYHWWRRSRQAITVFVRENRAELDEYIKGKLR